MEEKTDADIKPQTKEPLAAREVLRYPRRWHDAFNRKMWEGKNSFHNRMHIEAVEVANDRYLQNMGEGLDPLGVEVSRQRWNDLHPEEQLTQEELREAMPWVIRNHDLGNIMRTVTLTEGDFTPVFLDRYTGQDAEGRSQDIAETLIANSDLPDNKKRRFIPFVRHGIDETQFQMADPNSPFTIYMRTIDQVGNDLFSRDERRGLGLLEEMSGENPDVQLNPYVVFNYAREMFPKIVPDKKARGEVYKIWNKSLPPRRREFPNKDTKAVDILASLKR